jgi:hypothetical protein
MPSSNVLAQMSNLEADIWGCGKCTPNICALFLKITDFIIYNWLKYGYMYIATNENLD